LDSVKSFRVEERVMKSVAGPQGSAMCPKGGFPVKAELTFLGGATVAVSYNAPCPKK
jgi:hypothetical protein